MSKKKQTLILQAETLFKQFGFRKVSVEELCKHAQVSKVTFYKYFKNKTELVLHILQAQCDEMTLLEKAIINSEAPYAKRFQGLFQLHIDHMRSMGSPFLGDLMNPDNPEIYKTLCAADEKSMGDAQAFFKQGQAEGVLNPDLPDELFILILDISREWVQDPRFIALAPDVTKRLEMIVQLLFFGIQGHSLK